MVDLQFLPASASCAKRAAPTAQSDLLEVRYKGNFWRRLQMSERAASFSPFRKSSAARKLISVGSPYLQLGQKAASLSAAKRKTAPLPDSQAERAIPLLSMTDRGGSHPEDSSNFSRSPHLADRKITLSSSEHNMDVIVMPTTHRPRPDPVMTGKSDGKKGLPKKWLSRKPLKQLNTSKELLR